MQFCSVRCGAKEEPSVANLVLGLSLDVHCIVYTLHCNIYIVLYNNMYTLILNFIEYNIGECELYNVQIYYSAFVVQ